MKVGTAELVGRGVEVTLARVAEGEAVRLTVGVRVAEAVAVRTTVRRGVARVALGVAVVEGVAEAVAEAVATRVGEATTTGVAVFWLCAVSVAVGITRVKVGGAKVKVGGGKVAVSVGNGVSVGGAPKTVKKAEADSPKGGWQVGQIASTEYWPGGISARTVKPTLALPPLSK